MAWRKGKRKSRKKRKKMLTRTMMSVKSTDDREGGSAPEGGDRSMSAAAMAPSQEESCKGSAVARDLQN